MDLSLGARYTLAARQPRGDFAPGEHPGPIFLRHHKTEGE